MDRLEKIGREREMSKAMLTCLKGPSISLLLRHRTQIQTHQTLTMAVLRQRHCTAILRCTGVSKCLIVMAFYEADVDADHCRYQADEIDPTRMAEEESEDEEDWEEVGSDGEPLDRTVDYTILSKNLTR